MSPMRIQDTIKNKATSQNSSLRRILFRLIQLKIQMKISRFQIDTFNFQSQGLFVLLIQGIFMERLKELPLAELQAVNILFLCWQKQKSMSYQKRVLRLVQMLDLLSLLLYQMAFNTIILNFFNHLKRNQRKNNVSYREEKKVVQTGISNALKWQESMKKSLIVALIIFKKFQPRLSKTTTLLEWKI